MRCRRQPRLRAGMMGLRADCVMMEQEIGLTKRPGGDCGGGDNSLLRRRRNSRSRRVHASPSVIRHVLVVGTRNRQQNASVPSDVSKTKFLRPRPLLTRPRPPRPVAQCRHFQEEAEDAFVSECTWTRSALEALRNALYIFKTYLLYLQYQNKSLRPRPRPSEVNKGSWRI